MATKHRGMPKGFVSKAQWRLFFADPRLRRYAKKEARKTPGGKKVRYRRLPARKTLDGHRMVSRPPRRKK